MTPTECALARAKASSDPQLFMDGFRAGRAAKAGENTDAYVRSLLKQGDTAAAAGYLEGLASRRELPAEVQAAIATRRCRAARRAVAA